MSSDSKDALDSYKYDPTVDMSGYIPVEKRFKVSEPVTLVNNSDNEVGVYSSKEDQQYKEYLESSDDHDEPKTESDTFDAAWASAYESVREKIVSDGWASHGVFQVVGNGKVTNNDLSSPKRCGKMYGFVGCVKTHLHDKTTLDGVNHHGNAYVKKRIRHCFNPRCPKCYRSWASREAKFASWRIQKASVKYGKAEHIVASVPELEYSMFESGYGGYLKGRVRVQKVLGDRGVVGGGLIFHGFRFADAKKSRKKGVPFGWYWNPHWHIVGFLVDGYSMCRGCVHNCVTDREFCRKCSDGFEGRTRRVNDVDGWIVKVLGERKSILATFYYQLNHSTIIPSRKRFHSLTWFGVCGIRALKLDRSEFKEEPDLCPICGSKCVPLSYLGVDRAVIERQFWICEFEEPVFDSGGRAVWIEKTQGDSGGYANWE